MLINLISAYHVILSCLLSSWFLYDSQIATCEQSLPTEWDVTRKILRTNCSTWLPERALHFKYLCSYDAAIYDNNGDEMISYHSEHPYTRGVAFNTVAEWLIYGSLSPFKCSESDDYCYYDFITYFSLNENLVTTTNLGWWHSYRYGPGFELELNSVDSIDTLDYKIKPYCLHRIHVNKADNRFIKYDSIQKNLDTYSIFRYIIEYNQDGNVSKIRKLSAHNVSNTSDIWQYPEDLMSEIFIYKFNYADDIGYIEELIRKYESGREITLVKLENYQLKPMNINSELDRTIYDRYYETAYSR